MAQQRLIQAIGRIERALSRLEQAPLKTTVSADDSELIAKHEQLKAETQAAIRDIDRILAGQES
jgi:hypothetical protein